MSTTELDPGAGAAAAEEQQTALPEQETAGDAHQQSETGEGSDQSQGSDEADKGLTEEQKTIRKLERRIARLTGKRGAAEREAELLRQQLSQIHQGGSRQDDGEAEQTGNRALTEADIERLADQKAAEKARQRAIGEKVSKVLRDGAKLDGFNAAVDAVAEVVPFTDRGGKPTPFIEAVLDADDPAAVFKYLGDNPEEAEELAGLTPVQLGRRLAKLESKLGAKKQTSAAPTPIKPINGNSAGALEPDPERDAEAWIRARNRAERAARA